jgi:hypothetical protein
MTRASKAMTVMLVAALGAWGCARGPANQNAAHLEKIRTLEGKCVRLEEDYKAVAGARDQARRRATSLEEENARLHKELAFHRSVLQERDALRRQLDSRTTERDSLQLRCDRLKKGLQNLLGQDDAALSGTPSIPPVSSSGGATVANNPS